MDGAFIYSLCHEGRVIIAGTATTTTDNRSEVQKGSFSVTGFDLAEYKKRKPDVYRYAIYICNFFRQPLTNISLFRLKISQAGDDVLQFFEEGLIAPSYSLIAGMYKVNDALRSISENIVPGKVSNRQIFLYTFHILYKNSLNTRLRI